jgi:hypothetical protein
MPIVPAAARRSALALVSVVIAWASSVAPGVAGGTTVPIRFDVRIGARCVDGEVQGEPPVTLVLRSPSGEKLATKHGAATSGTFHICLDRAVKSRDRLTARTPTDERTITVPRLGARLDRVRDRLTGRGPDLADLEAQVTTCTPGACTVGLPFPVAVTERGTFRRDLDPMDITGSDRAEVTLERGSGDRFIVTAFAPVMEVRHDGPAMVRVLADRLGPVTLTLRSDSGQLRATATRESRHPGAFLTIRFRNNGTPVTIHGGDRIVGDLADDATMRVPPLAVALDAAADTVTATCFPGQPFMIFAASGDFAFGTAGPDGSIAEQVDQDSGDTVTIDCQDRRGDRIRLRGVTP